MTKGLGWWLNLSKTLEWEQAQNHILKTLIEKYPLQLLTILWLRDSQGVMFPLGLFSCMKCSKPISHEQFNFATLCGGCDIGEESPLWTIIKPKNE